MLEPSYDFAVKGDGAVEVRDYRVRSELLQHAGQSVMFALVGCWLSIGMIGGIRRRAGSRSAEHFRVIMASSLQLVSDSRLVGTLSRNVNTKEIAG